MSGTASLPPSYFDALYASDPDPWRFQTSEYESGKYAATMAALPRAAFPSAFEVGCSIGVLTRMLADRCDALLAVDVAEAAIVQARRRCDGLTHVTIERMQVPDKWPTGRFDLIVLSEVLYYLSPEALERTASLTCAALTGGGVALLVHYTLPTNYPASGDAAAEAFIARSGLRIKQQRREAAYRLDLLGA